MPVVLDYPDRGGDVREQVDHEDGGGRPLDFVQHRLDGGIGNQRAVAQQPPAYLDRRHSGRKPQLGVTDAHLGMSVDVQVAPGSDAPRTDL